MVNILLVCAAGMSTSLLVAKMENAAKARALEVNIRAVAVSEAARHLDQADVVLLGPQVRYMVDKVQKDAEPYGIRVGVIDPVHYGMIHGDAVLQQALRLQGSHENL
ncbi:PTS sugar transporter subunit IIB [Caenibacillus caldisaponilyticus]|jgi:PTS system cellobiose-specific IIB component|uniref:PTS sugar transporter subunit IIB n=1 Tax=Caenibacillus caldisaponilyticus TaxID=1674942 RepID=UPI00098842A1|nr:PTS sugar transporter subunit IIB [Caenibacillus caldisaponilyticus]